MSQFFKETAHTKTDMDKYRENFDHIFRKYKCNCHLFEDCTCEKCKPSESPDQNNPPRVVVEEFGPCDL